MYEWKEYHTWESLTVADILFVDSYEVEEWTIVVTFLLTVNIKTTPIRAVSVFCEVSTPTTCVEVTMTFIEELNLTFVLDNLIESILRAECAASTPGKPTR